VKRSDLAGWAEYGYRPSRSRYLWGLRLHLITTLHGLPVGWALTGTKADERHVPADIVANTPGLAALSQMDVPTRQALVMSVVRPEDRTSAAALTNAARYTVRPAGTDARRTTPDPGRRVSADRRRRRQGWL
jgi:hypothetical protein